MVFLAKKNPKTALERVQKGNTITIPFCTSGWNTRDVPSAMSPEDGLIMDNIVVENGRIVTRKGFSEAGSNYGDEVESIFQYSGSSYNKIIVAAGSKIFSGLGSTPTQLGTGFTSARWDAVMMNNYLLLFNGSDTPQKYDGSSLTSNTFTGSGLTATALSGCTVFKNRLILWENFKNGFWYGSSDAISGTLTYFDLSFTTKLGGYVVCCETWSLDNVSSLQARLVIFMSTGECLVYDGTNPGDANAWSLVGRYKVAPPVSRRAIISFSGDILLVNKYDLISFSEVFQNGEVPDSQSKLVGALKTALANYGANYGWELIFYPLGSLILINIPISTSSQYQQLVLNTRSGGASRFLNMNGSTWCIYNNQLYFGGNGKIYLADDGFDDDGDNIDFDIQMAFSNFGVAKEKTINFIKPSILLEASTNFSSSLNYDFQNSGLQTVASNTPEGLTWDTFYWDTELWSPEAIIKSIQYGAVGQGIFVSYRIKASTKGQQIAFYSIFYSFEIDNL